jgi:hypothetical protein
MPGVGPVKKTGDGTVYLFFFSLIAEKVPGRVV